MINVVIVKLSLETRGYLSSVIIIEDIDYGSLPKVGTTEIDIGLLAICFSCAFKKTQG